MSNNKESTTGNKDMKMKDNLESGIEMKDGASPMDCKNYLEEESKEKDVIIQEQKKTIKILCDRIEEYKKKVETLELQLENTNTEPETSIGNQTKGGQSRYWTAEEHQRFLEAIKRYGDKDIKSIAAHVGSRNATQVRTHLQKYYLRLDREKRKKDGLSPPMESNGMIKAEPSPKKKLQIAATKRRKSVGDYPHSLHSKVSQESARNPSPVIPHFIQQQIATETRDSVLAMLQGWTSEHYNAFIEGLVSHSDEKDINRRCKLISENNLPNFTAEQVKQCFCVLSSVAKAKEREEPRDDFSVQSKQADEYFRACQQKAPVAEAPEFVREYDSNQYSSYSANRIPQNISREYQFPAERRNSFPQDPSWKHKQQHPDPADTFDSDPLPGSWSNNHHNGGDSEYSSNTLKM